MKEKNLDIKGYIRANGYTINDLADMLGISRFKVSNGLNFMEIALSEKQKIKQMIKEAKENGKNSK